MIYLKQCNIELVSNNKNFSNFSLNFKNLLYKYLNDIKLCSNKKQIGKFGESIAYYYFLDKGYNILYKNYKNKFGEIDLIVLNNTTIYFVEVKIRQNNIFGLANESIKEHQIKRITNASNKFISENKKFSNFNCEFILFAIQMYNNNFLINIISIN